LILGDGCSLTVEGDAGDAGINVSYGSNLTIYAQPKVLNIGSLIATATVAGNGYAGAGIGGGQAESCGNIIICGGNITANGCDTGTASDIGGGRGGNGGNILIYGENTTVTTRSFNIGYSSAYGTTSGIVFVALPEGQLKVGSTNVGNTVLFTANPASQPTNTVTVTLPAPFDAAPFDATPFAAGTYPLLTGLDETGKAMSVYTTVDARFALTGYLNSPLTKTADQLKSSGATVPFYGNSGNEDDYGLIFDAGTGKFYLNFDIDANGNFDATASINTSVPYTGQAGAWSWNSGTRVLSLNGFQWTTSASMAFMILDLAAGSFDSSGTSNSAITINLTGDNSFTSSNAATSNAIASYIGDLILTGTGSIDAVAGVAGISTGWMSTTGNLTVSGATLNATGNDAYYSIGLACNSFTQSGGTVNASSGTSVIISSGMMCNRGIISGGTLNATAGHSANVSYGIGAPIVFSDGTVIASGYTSALSGNPAISAPYTYWTNSSAPSDPGGSGKSVPPDPGYSYSPSDLFVKFTKTASPPVVPPPARQPASLTLSATGGSYSNNSITLTATVEAGFKPAPTGTVIFKEGNTTLGAKTLNRNGTATYTIAAPIAPGSYTYTADYSGDDNYFDATGDPCTVDVTAFLSVSPATLHFDASGGTQPVTIECTAGWSLDCDTRWLTPSVSESESNNTRIILNVTAAANPDAAPRTALITLSLPGIMVKTVGVTQAAAENPSTAVDPPPTPSVTVYAQGGNAIVKSDTPVKSVAVYDVSGRLLKEVKGESNSIEITGLPKEQTLIVKVTEGHSIKNYKLKIIN